MGFKIGKVYRIVKVDDPTINYIGSTFTTLRQRWNIHKNKTHNKCSIGEYIDKYGIDKFKIILIKEYKVCAETQKDNKHLRAYEQLWINKFRLKKSCINKKEALCFLKQQIRKKWRDNNKENRKVYHKEYFNKYYKNNSEKLKDYQKEYKKNNSEKIKEKIECSICKSLICKRYLYKQIKTIKCINAK